jgi:hypothetical protein
MKTTIMNMKIIFTVFVAIVLINLPVYSQTILEADGPGDTYELINSVLAPGYNVVEHPECVHPEFGRHVAEVWDSVLNQYVFEFYMHVTPDNDRCINYDRQRMEIKTYDQSPDSLIGVVGETVTYKWKFKLPSGFQPSSNFTHIHQIKPVGGDDGNPIFALTPRKGSPDRLELKYNNTTVVETVALSLIEDVWVECTEVIYIDPVNGTYSMTINKVSDGTTLLSYTNNNLMTIRPDNNFIRPKWGIYRSLLAPSDLRDEAVRFASFYIFEGILVSVEPNSSDEDAVDSFELYQNYPNPFNPSTTISYSIPEEGLVRLSIYNTLGELIKELMNEIKEPGYFNIHWNAKDINSGVYFLKLEANNFVSTKKMLLIR